MFYSPRNFHLKADSQKSIFGAQLLARNEGWGYQWINK